MSRDYRVILSEQELALVIAALDTHRPDKAEAELSKHLAKRLDAELWQPYYEDVARGRVSAAVRNCIQAEVFGPTEDETANEEGR